MSEAREWRAEQYSYRMARTVHHKRNDPTLMRTAWRVVEGERTRIVSDLDEQTARLIAAAPELAKILRTLADAVVLASEKRGQVMDLTDLVNAADEVLEKAGTR